MYTFGMGGGNEARCADGEDAVFAPCAARQNRRSREWGQKKQKKRDSKINLAKRGNDKECRQCLLAPMAHHQHFRKRGFNVNAKDGGFWLTLAD